MRPIITLYFAFCSTLAMATKPVFKDCDSPKCNQQKLEAFEKETLSAIVKNTGYTVADSLFFSFTVSENGEMEIMEEYTTTSTLNLIFTKKRLYKLASQLNPNQNYTWSWHIDVPKSQKKFQPFEDAKKYPQVPQCNTFNEKGKKACFRYVMEVAEGEVYDATSSEKASYKLYISKGKVIAASATQLPIGKSFTDRVILTINSKINEMTAITDRQNSDDFTIDVDFSLTGDSADRYNEYLRRLDYLITFPSKDMYLDEVLDFKRSYYGKKPKEGTAFFLEKLSYLGFDTLSSTRIKGKQYSIDSIKNIVETGVVPETDDNIPLSFAVVESVPVYDGCSKYRKDNDDLKNCFQQKIIKHVGNTFKYPEGARMRGIQGRVYINFVIEKDGSFDQIQIVRGVDPLLDYEAIRVVSEIPDADKPAMQRGKAVRMSFTLPINAKLK